MISGNKNLSQLRLCLDSAHNFLLSKNEAQEICDCIIEAIRTNWDTVCKEAELQEVEKNFFWGRQFLNSFSLL